jgi:hypothetical protein
MILIKEDFAMMPKACGMGGLHVSSTLEGVDATADQK